MKSKRLSVLCASLLAAICVIAEETAELSPAELAILAKQQERAAEQFLLECEHILMAGSDTERKQLISDLEGKTCNEAADALVSPTSD